MPDTPSPDPAPPVAAPDADAAPGSLSDSTEVPEPPAEAAPAEPPRLATRDEVDQASYWEQVYVESEDNSPGWNLGEPNSEFSWQLDHALPPIGPGAAVVLGCGYGHDAALFASRGFAVTAVDFSDTAIAGARQTAERWGVELGLVQADVFALPDGWSGQFDYVIEHTCYCAIHPTRRREYAELAHRLLRPGGQFVGLFYAHGRPGGPPYDTTPEEVRAIWSDLFDMRTLIVAQHNVEKRRGKELYGRFWRKG